MTALETVDRPLVRSLPINPARTRPRSRLTWRLLQVLFEHGVTHLTLLVLAGVFVFPFAWMFGMSLKTDEEATNTAIFPAIPTYCAASPFVLQPDAVDRPAMAGRDEWDQLYPQFVAEALAKVSAVVPPSWMFPSDLNALRQAAAIEATGRGVDWIDQDLWARTGDPAAVMEAFRNGLAHVDLNDVLNGRLARLELGGLQVRSLSGHVIPILQDGQLWKVVSGNAELLRGQILTGQVLRYRFANASAAPIVLRAAFDAMIPPEQLHRLLVAYQGDGSWHHIDVDLSLGDQRYRSEQTTYIALHRGASLLLQPPTFQDQTLGPRNWVSLSLAGRGIDASSSTRATLTLTLSPSSAARAVWGKFQRNYSRAFRSMPFWTYVGNSVVIVVLQVAGALFSSGFVGYAFARLNWPGRSVAMGTLLATMMLPTQVTMIPSFLIWRSLGWYNTLNPLWIGAWFGNAFFIFLMVQHMRTIPRELDDAARIDGMNEFQAWWYVMMPQVKPTLAAIAIMTFTAAWNEFMQPLILLRDQTKFPLGLGLFAMRIDANVDWPLIMAGNLLMTLPVVVIFFLFQRYFVEGVTVTGMKG